MNTPLTEVRLLNNVNLDNNYGNTFSRKLFGNLNGQVAFFQAKTVYTESNLTFQRKERTIKFPRPFESVENLSYGMFKNGAGKWYFFFIEDCTYLSDAVTELKIKIDVEQTYLFNVTHADCFIEREHTASDIIGEHTVAEGIDIGELTNVGYSTTTQIENLVYILASTVNAGGTQVQGGVYTDIYSGVRLYASQDPTFLNSFVNNLESSGKADSIVSISVMPNSLVEYDDTTGIVVPQGALFVETGVDKNLTNIDGYTPKNKKLFVHPYNFLQVTDHKGGMQIYPYEYFSSSEAGFFITSNVSPSACVTMSPKNYKGIAINHDESMTLGDYPQCAWVVDAFKNWLAQNASSTAIRFGGSAVAVVGGLASVNPLAVLGGLGGAVSSIGNLLDASLMPPRAKGDPNGSGNVARGKQTFGFLKKCVRAERARVIDDFFTMYGYKINRVKTPNVTSRSRYNYLKTQDTTLIGNIPREALSEMIANRVKGITFWHVDAIGDYTTANGF